MLTKTKQKSSNKQNVTPIRRDLRFNLDADRVTDWHPMGEHVTTVFNTLSLFFPVGERFFIDSVRHYRDSGAITDPELLTAVRAFIGQEAMHGREHEEYNDLLVKAGLPIEQLEGFVTTLLKVVRKTTPAQFQLGVTVALEHWTAILAGFLLDHPKTLEGADKNFAAMWNWHALEETEHKAVAFDVYRAVAGNGVGAEAVRASSQIVATTIFWSLVFPFHARNILAQRGVFKGLLNPVGWFQYANFTFGRKPGFLSRLIPDYLEYFKPSFHPWDQDNRHHLEKIEHISQQFAA